MPEANLPYIPEFITVHLGTPSQQAQNVTVSFPDYIKNVCSSEIFPTWPEAAIRANIYVQVTFALNRVYTEWYRSRGYDFDITSSTQYDQAFVYGREFFGNISRLVDELFNNYIVRRGSIEPLFAAFCNGTTVTCSGLSQWGTVTLANQGYTPYEMLQYYYGEDIDIVRNAPISPYIESYPGTPFGFGSAGNEVRQIQLELNRIGTNYPAIPKIVPANGLYGESTVEAVRVFQGIFSLPQTGIVNKATWYQIKFIFTAVKELSELSSEGLSIEEVTNVLGESLRLGDYGLGVRNVQYFLNVIAYFNPEIPMVQASGVFNQALENQVKAFERFYGLNPDGVVDFRTFQTIRNVYNDIR
ncbi:MAG: peptidoglycan-binding protein, partial [Oscillospiraceae bacterium]